MSVLGLCFMFGLLVVLLRCLWRIWGSEDSGLWVVILGVLVLVVLWGIWGGSAPRLREYWRQACEEERREEHKKAVTDYAEQFNPVLLHHHRSLKEKLKDIRSQKDQLHGLQPQLSDPTAVELLTAELKEVEELEKQLTGLALRHYQQMERLYLGSQIEALRLDRQAAPTESGHTDLSDLAAMLPTAIGTNSP